MPVPHADPGMEGEVGDGLPVVEERTDLLSTGLHEHGEIPGASMKTIYIRQNANFRAQRNIKEFKYSSTFITGL